MPTWTLEVIGRSREIYNVEAETEEEAREKFRRGEVAGPFLTEIDDAEVEEATQEED